MQRFTKKDQETLDFIIEFEKQHIFPPSIREICEGTGISSTSTVYHRLRKLEGFGKIRLDENGRIMLTGFKLVEKDGHPMHHGPVMAGIET